MSRAGDSACLSSLTAKVWATREAFVKLLSARQNIPVAEISTFFSTSQELTRFLLQQFIDVSRVQEALECAVGHQAIADCTLAVSLSRHIEAMTPPNPALGEAMWALTSHPDSMARCDAALAAASHWRGYLPGQRMRCIELLKGFVSQSLREKESAAIGFKIGSALSGMVLLDDEEQACKFLTSDEALCKSERAIALSILALSLSAASSSRKMSVWRELLRERHVDDCETAVRLYFCRGSAMKELRFGLDPNGAMCQDISLPIYTGSVFRMLACGFYARNEDFRSFVKAAVQRGWIVEVPRTNQMVTNKPHSISEH